MQATFHNDCQQLVNDPESWADGVEMGANGDPFRTIFTLPGTDFWILTGIWTLQEAWYEADFLR